MSRSSISCVGAAMLAVGGVLTTSNEAAACGPAATRGLLPPIENNHTMAGTFAEGGRARCPGNNQGIIVTVPIAALQEAMNDRTATGIIVTFGEAARTNACPIYRREDPTIRPTRQGDVYSLSMFVSSTTSEQIKQLQCIKIEFDPRPPAVS